MKKLVLLTSSISLAILLAGCLTTLHPIFTAKDLVSDKRLAGNWEKTRDKSPISFRPLRTEEIAQLPTSLQALGGKISALEERNEQGRIESTSLAFMVKIGKNSFLDVYPFAEEATNPSNAFFAAHYVAKHSIYRIRFSNDNLFALQQLDGGYLENLIKNKQIRIKHEVMEDGSFVITAPTEELQQYLLKYGDVPEAYSEDANSTYTRIH